MVEKFAFYTILYIILLQQGYTRIINLEGFEFDDNCAFDFRK